MRQGLFGALLVLGLLASDASAQTCTKKTRTLPGGSPAQQLAGVVLPPGESIPVFYVPPANGASLVFWVHVFPDGLPVNSVGLAMYHMVPSGVPDVFDLYITGVVQNGTGQPNNFALSTPLNPGERWQIHARNNNAFSVTVFLEVTILECVA